MDESPEKAGNYAHADFRNKQFTRLMLGMGAFESSDYFNDEITLREEVQGFYVQHHNELHAVRDAYLTVPYLSGSYAEACREGDLVAKVAPVVAAKSMLACGVVGEFEQMLSVHEAYRSTITMYQTQLEAEAQAVLSETLRRDTAPRSELFKDVPDDNEVKVHYRQTLRRLMGWSALSSGDYETRMLEANMKPVPVFMQRLNQIFYRE